MYVIGINKWDFINVKSRTMMTWEFCKTWNEVEKVTYECNLVKATIFSDYEIANKNCRGNKNKKR